jgi:hypothetical protein
MAKYKNPHDKMSKEDEQNPLKVQDMAPEPARCKECNQLLPDGIEADEQKSGLEKGPKQKEPKKHPEAYEEEKKKMKGPKMRHGAY